MIHLHHAWAELWGKDPLRLVITSCVSVVATAISTVLIISALNRGAPVASYYRSSDTPITISGVDILVPVNRQRTAWACPGAIAKRLVVSYDEGQPHTEEHFDDVFFVRETALADDAPGTGSYSLHMHLEGPLPAGYSKPLFYFLKINDNCGFFGNIFNRRQSVAPPARVVVK